MCFWRLKIKAEYKNWERENLEFNFNWIDVIYTTKEMAIPNSRNIAGVIMFSSSLDRMISGEVKITPLGTQPSPISGDLLFLAPKNKEEITHMCVTFLDYPKVQIIPPQQKEEIGGKPK